MTFSAATSREAHNPTNSRLAEAGSELGPDIEDGTRVKTVTLRLQLVASDMAVHSG